MIIDKIENLGRYPQFAEVSSQILGFLKRVADQKLADGKYQLDGEALYAIVQSYRTMEKAAGRMESHKDYADFQYMHRGEEVVFYDCAEMLEVACDCRPECDIIYYKARSGQEQSLLAAGMFGYFEPQDAHMPCIRHRESCDVKKVVFKILLKKAAV